MPQNPSCKPAIYTNRPHIRNIVVKRRRSCYREVLSPFSFLRFLKPAQSELLIRLPFEELVRRDSRSESRHSGFRRFRWPLCRAFRGVMLRISASGGNQRQNRRVISVGNVALDVILGISIPPRFGVELGMDVRPQGGHALSPWARCGQFGYAVASRGATE